MINLKTAIETTPTITVKSKLFFLIETNIILMLTISTATDVIIIISVSLIFKFP